MGTMASMARLAGIFAVALTCLAGSATAAPQEVGASPDTLPSSAKRGWLSAVWGTPLEDGIFYLPYGLHHNSTRIDGFQLVGGIYRSLYAMTFINSDGDRTWSVGFERNVYSYRRLRLGYGAGLVYGYGGRLADSPHLPLAHTFLFEHDINPVLGVPAHLVITKRVQLESFVTPLVTLGGLKIVF
jgi:hypothetical protein